MKHTKLSLIFLLFLPFAFWGQSVGVMPTHLPDYIYGAWVDENNELALIVSEDYVVVNKELYRYNEIVLNKNRLDFTCIQNYSVKYFGVVKVNVSAILLDEGFRVTQLKKINYTPNKVLPNFLVDNWYSSKKEMQLHTDSVLILNDLYKIDNVITFNDVNYFVVLYKTGEYYLIYNYTDNEGHFLSTNFSEPAIFKKQSFFKKYKLEIILLAVILALLLSYGIIRWKIKHTKRQEKEKRLFVEMQLKSIRSQMNPHFIFNALSAIQNLINKSDNEKANHYLTEFSQLMRLTLDKSEKGLVPLIDEITSIKKYLELEKLRFNFDYNIYLDDKIDTLQTEIPAMLIQPFIENAIIHGLYEVKGTKVLSVEFKIEENNLVCIILDNGIGIEKAQQKKKTNISTQSYGLKLAKSRIALINANYSINTTIKIADISKTDNSKTGTMVEVFMPLKY